MNLTPLSNEILNYTCNVKIQSTNSWYESAIFGVIVGAIISCLTAYFWIRRKEKKELEEFEYRLLSNVHRLIIEGAEGKNKKTLKSFVNQIYSDPRIPKIKSGSIILKTADKILDGKDISDEQKKIKKLLSTLRKK